MFRLFGANSFNLFNRNSRYAGCSTTNTANKKLVILDLDETFFSRYVRGIGSRHDDGHVFSHYAPCSTRQQYFWINKRAWQAVIPKILTEHDVVLLTASICHEEFQIKNALNQLLPYRYIEQNNCFLSARLYTGNDFGNRHTLKGEKILALKNHDIFKKYAFNQMILVDDNLEHIQSASSLGIEGIRAGESDYFTELCNRLGFDIELPPYDSYELGWDSETRQVTLLGDHQEHIRLI